jgi:5-hydroxyisourate hydrolase-like protein (transthyretin family)
MKIKITVLIVLLITFTGMAYMMESFAGWDRLESKSHYIIIAHCGAPTPRLLHYSIENAAAFDSSIEVLSVLKGTNDLVFTRLQTDHELRQGEYYIAFGYGDNFDTNVFMAHEDFHVIPLGHQFTTNSIAGKQLNEQLQILFRQSADNLNREIQKDKEEKQRIESGIVK